MDDPPAPAPGALRLILFDMDGTLIDGAPQIVAAMDAAFAALGRPAPEASAVRQVIGLDLEEAVRRLDPALDAPDAARATAAYRQVFAAARRTGGGEAAAPLYPGAAETLARLSRTDALLGIATGKARRGLAHALAAHGLERYFTTTQSASEGPGKPHPRMIETALAETGVAPGDAVMIGDAIYDMEMARNAGAAAIGVAWGYHARPALIEAGAATVIERFEALEPALDRLWGPGWRRLTVEAETVEAEGERE